MVAGIQFRFCMTADACFEDAKRLRDRTLFQPLGVVPPSGADDRDPHHRHLVVLIGGRVVGYGRLTVRGREAEISHLCVDPSLRGQGVGTDIVRRLLDRARTEGVKGVHLNARFTALGLYRQIGFTEVGPVFNPEGMTVPHKRLEIAL